MVKKTIILLLILSVFLVACQSTTTNLPTEPSAESNVEPDSADTNSTHLPPLPEVSPTPSTEQADNLGEVNCTVVSRQPTPGPTEQSLVPAVSDADWTHGPEDASLTIIEYGDFQ